MGYIRFAHFSAGQIMAVGFLLRIYWAFVGNAHSAQIFYIPFWRGDFWKGVLLRNPLVRLSGKIAQAICRA